MFNVQRSGPLDVSEHVTFLGSGHRASLDARLDRTIPGMGKIRRMPTIIHSDQPEYVEVFQS